MEPDAPGADEVVVSLYHTIDAGKLSLHREEVKALFARNASLRSRAARYIASAGSLLLDSRRAEACCANFEKVRRYAKRLCTRMLPRLPDTARPGEELRLLSAITPKGPVFYHAPCRHWPTGISSSAMTTEPSPACCWSSSVPRRWRGATTSSPALRHAPRRPDRPSLHPSLRLAF